MAGAAPTPQASLQTRIASAALVTALAVLLAACVSFVALQWVEARQDAEHAQLTLTESIAAGLTPSIAAGSNSPAMKMAFTRVMETAEVRSAQLFARDGSVLAEYHEPEVKGRAPRPPAKASVAPMVMNGQKVGELSLVAEPPRLNAILIRGVLLCCALFFASAGLALFLGRSLARKVVEPIQRLTDGIGEVARSGRFNPVPVSADDPMIERLAGAFNHLLKQLDANDQDLRAAMAELVKARDAADAASVLKSQFLANMSHEIRTPLNGVLGMAEVVAMGDLTPVQRQRVEVIRQSGQGLLAILNDVLDLSKIEAGKLDIVEGDFDLASLAKGARQTFAGPAAEKSLALTVEVEPAALGVWRGDADRLRQILNNLLSNAVKFTAEGAVHARFSAVAGGLKLVVRDTGIGIPSSALPTLFDKFVQADATTTRRFGGTGLGLAICRELALLMGGVVTVDSREGVGSAFTLQLPLKHGRTVDAAPAVEGPARSRRLRLLAADDNPTNQKVLAALLTPLQPDLHMVDDGRQAVEAWRSGDYDAILMDIHMPVMDGVDATRQIRAEEAAAGRPRTPILAVTADAMSHQVASFLAAGMDDHVAKPVELAKLHAAILRAVAGRATQTAGAAPGGGVMSLT
ncbi:MAG: hybrid sensor histidine kinase/response regulator [Caulobacterales bacterium 68-7]|nr:response regulator [Caulobacterales bacterium]OJU09865.1 MAG: hybrid sensor histidine kinase/response regulator [Caulobacterales bacterium 68-7]